MPGSATPRTVGRTTVGEIIGRQRELELGEGVLAAVERGPAGLVLRGEPGIGKTALVEEIRRRALARGLVVLRCAPVESDAQLALAGLGDLLAGVASAVLPDLRPPQRHTLEIALLLRESTGAPVDPRALGVALLAVLDRLSSTRPVLVAIDDLQWLDAATAHALAFALRRSRDLRVGVLLSSRLPGATPLPLDAGTLVGPVTEVVVGPLSVAALFGLLRDRVGVELPRPQLVRLHEACAGNPLHALVIARELREGRLRLSPGEPVPLPESLRGLVELRMRRLPARAREVLAAAASLSRPSVEVLDEAFGRAVVERAADRAAAAGVAALDRDVLRFAHPLYAAASYAGVSPPARRRIHRALAAVVPDPEEQARQLALGSARRDAEAARALELAAERAVARGAAAAGAELADLALDLTPRGAEADRLRRTLRAVELHVTAGALARARALGGTLLADLPPGPERAQATLALAPALADDLERTTSLLERALDEPSLDDALRAHLLAELAEVLFRRGQARAALEPARRGLEHARLAGDRRVMLALVAHLATVEFWSGFSGPGQLLDEHGHGPLRAWVETETRAGLGLPFAASPRAALATRLVHLGAHAEARSLFTVTLAEATARGDEPTRARTLWHLASLEDYDGDWRRAAELVTEANELEEQLGIESGAVFFARAGQAAVLGRVEETERLVAEGVARAAATGDVPYELLTLGVLGFLRFSEGDAAGAVAILVPVIERATELSEPRINRYWPDTIEALVAVGEQARAQELLATYADEAARLRVPRSLARAAHCRGVLATAAGSEQEALAALEEALAIHERCPNAFEHARTLLALGIAQRRFRHRADARATIDAARSRFESLAAPLWAERARSELARTGTRRRVGEGLTATEETVARLAAQGLTNREIGQRAHLTARSVEDVLRRVYRTLGVRNKAELAGLLGSATGTDSVDRT